MNPNSTIPSVAPCSLDEKPKCEHENEIASKIDKFKELVRVGRYPEKNTRGLPGINYADSYCGKLSSDRSAHLELHDLYRNPAL